jgi:hypothetical protein
VSRVRTFNEDDIPQVVALKWRFLHNGSGSPPPTMDSYFRELFFRGPFSEKTLPSLVYENEHGRVVGFLGILRRRMLWGGKPIEAAVGTSLVVEPDSRSTMAGLKLINWFLSGKQDVAITDTANHLTQQLWGLLGGSQALLYAMHWSRPLRPAQYAVSAARRFGRGPFSEVFAVGSKPVCSFVDAIAARIASSPFRQRLSFVSEEELTVETLLACMRDFSEPSSLRLEYDKDSMSWLLDFMGRMKAYGSLRKVLLRNEENKIIGWYLYYLEKGGVGEVVQVGASRSSADAVIDHLCFDAWTHGAIALHGRLDPHLSQQPLGRRCFYFLGTRLLVHSRDPELVRHIQSGSAFLTRLDGEWCLRFGTPAKGTCRGAAGYRSDTADSGLATQQIGQGLKTSISRLMRLDSGEKSRDLCHNSPLDGRGPLSGSLSRRLDGEPR